MMILDKFDRRDLSNFLQITTLADNAGYPLPCWIVEQAIEAHDRLLNHPTQHPKKNSGPTPAQTPRKNKIGAIQNQFCAIHRFTALHRAECGKVFCPDCVDNINV